MSREIVEPKLDLTLGVNSFGSTCVLPHMNPVLMLVLEKQILFVDNKSVGRHTIFNFLVLLPVNPYAKYKSNLSMSTSIYISILRGGINYIIDHFLKELALRCSCY